MPQHRLRYWESRFPQLRPLTRAGDRRYYRPDDVALVRRIHLLLVEQGYTVRGVQAMLAREAAVPPVRRIDELRAVRAILAQALAADG